MKGYEAARFLFFLVAWNGHGRCFGFLAVTTKANTCWHGRTIDCPNSRLILVGKAPKGYFSSRACTFYRNQFRVNASEKDEETDGDYKLQDPKFIQRNKRWVIIADDEEAIRLAVGDFLYDQGYQVTACADADSLLEVCAKPRSDGELPAIPDTIISDIRMPGKDGIELLGLIRADERLARVPVILLTAKAMTQDRVEGYKAGADVYLPKPFDPDELLSIIDNIIQRRQQMSGTNGNLMDLKQDMENIKQIMRRNSVGVVKKTDVYLTDVERDVLNFICKGYTNAEIAAERGVGVIGINRMIQKLYLETQTQTRTELVRWAITTGYVPARS
jgi:DNA-binding NarL/FixJ family response regulator